MAATAFLLLAVVYLLIDVADFWSGSPLIYVGMNPILVSKQMALFSVIKSRTFSSFSKIKILKMLFL